jgi:hypothetical protein
MIGTLFASPPREINEMEIHIGSLSGRAFLHPA